MKAPQSSQSREPPLASKPARWLLLLIRWPARVLITGSTRTSGYRISAIEGGPTRLVLHTMHFSLADPKKLAQRTILSIC